jgi:hypothetical protein
MMEDQEPSREEVVPKKRGRKAKRCQECRLKQKICTHEALPEDLDKENLALAPAERTRRKSGVLLLPRDSSNSTTLSSSSPTPSLAVVSPSPAVGEEQMITRGKRKILHVKSRYRSAINSLNIAKRWKRNTACDDAGKDVWQKVDGVLAAAKDGHVLDLASAKTDNAKELIEVQRNHEAALGNKDKTIRQLEADIRRLKAELNNIQRGCLVDEKLKQLELKLVGTESKHKSEVRDFRRQITEMQKCHEIETKALCTDKDKEIERLKAKIGNITRGALIDEKVERLEKQLADQSTEHTKEIRGYRRQITELQSKHDEEIGRILAVREERTRILNQTCDELRKSLEASRIEVVRLQGLEREHDWQNRLLALNLGKRASECVPEYDASAMKWTSDEGEKASQTPKVTTKFKARKIVAALYKEAKGNRESAIDLLRAMTRNVVAGELFSELGWKGQGRDPAEAQKQVRALPKKELVQQEQERRMIIITPASQQQP